MNYTSYFRKKQNKDCSSNTTFVKQMSLLSLKLFTTTALVGAIEKVYIMVYFFPKLYFFSHKIQMFIFIIIQRSSNNGVESPSTCGVWGVLRGEG